MTMMRDAAEDRPANGLEGFTSRTLSHARVYFSGAGAPTILFVHGGFHGAWCWSKVLSFLASRGIGAAALDLRGHGGLPQTQAFIAQGVDNMVADVVEAARTMPARVFLAGHSLGALIALKAAEHLAPRGLILMAPATPAGVAKNHTLPPFPAGRAIQPPDAGRVRKWFLSGDSSTDLDDYVSRLCPESPKLLNECFHEGISAAPERIACPVFCLSGGKDDSPLHPAGQDQAIAACYGAALRTIPHSGHCLMLDDGWLETAAAICVWVSGAADT
jgi:pimeloyl-ACP methyl ester carboxylesterase